MSALVEYRCAKCARLLFKAEAHLGRIQTQCPRCGTIQMVTVAPPLVRLTRATA